MNLTNTPRKMAVVEPEASFPGESFDAIEADAPEVENMEVAEVILPEASKAMTREPVKVTSSRSIEAVHAEFAMLEELTAAKKRIKALEEENQRWMVEKSTMTTRMGALQQSLAVITAELNSVKGSPSSYTANPAVHTSNSFAAIAAAPPAPRPFLAKRSFFTVPCNA